MARQGKIARLPAKIREELNQRLLDGESGSKILPWLNALPRVKEILGEDFEGLAVNDANLSDWRQGGFADWVRQRGRIDRTRELARYAAEQSKANGASIADGAAAIASGQLLELLEIVDEAVEDGADLREGAQGAAGEAPAAAREARALPRMTPDTLLKIAAAVSSLRTTEQNDVKLKLQGKLVAQKERQISLDEQKFRRDTAAIAIKVLGDERAKGIEAGTGTNAEKIELMGQHIFGDLWTNAETLKR